MASHDHPSCIQAPDLEQQKSLQEEKNVMDYSQRSSWLRATVLGATDGLVSTASLMVGIGATKEDITAMILAGFAGLVAGACSMAIGEYVSVHSQLDMELAQQERENKKSGTKPLANPLYAVLASALSFAIGAGVPLLPAAFISNHKVRLGVVAGTASLALIMFGGLSAVLGKAPVKRSCFRVFIGGWSAMVLTFGVSMAFSGLFL
ncbi:hypothetical protein ACHQM5_016862 [Ranunculus cassubicifolius]